MSADGIRYIQQRLGVSADGVWGPKTRAAFDAAVPERASSFDDTPFFAKVRKDFGGLKQSQVDGFNDLLKGLKGWPVSWVAYALATTWHETAATMQPIKERGGEAYFHRMYDPQGQRPNVARDLGNTQPGDGVKFAGRGYVQLTGRRNYARYGLVDNPDDAMRPEVAAHVLRDGMETGAFTGRKLSDYLPGDYRNARRIINGLDAADDIARYAISFEAALRDGGW